jgi:hypothetical protein
MKGERNVYGILVRKPNGKDHCEDLDVGGNIMLKCILDRMVWCRLV